MNQHYIEPPLIVQNNDIHNDSLMYNNNKSSENATFGVTGGEGSTTDKDLSKIIFVKALTNSSNGAAHLQEASQRHNSIESLRDQSSICAEDINSQF
jgi:predicted RNase H-related nuclease YkuK (DUF458 family)